MEGQKIIYERHDIHLPVGNTGDSQTIAVKHGTCIGVKLIPFGATNLDHAINIGVEDTSGNEKVALTDFRDYIPIGGSYRDGFKPTRFNTVNSLVVKVMPSEAIKATSFKAQLVFMIIANSN